MIFIANVFTKVTPFIYTVILGKHLKPMEANQENKEPNLEQNKELQETQTYESWVKPKMTTSFAQDKQELLDNYLKTIPEERRPKNISQLVLFLLDLNTSEALFEHQNDLKTQVFQLQNDLLALEADRDKAVNGYRDLETTLLKKEEQISALVDQNDAQIASIDLLQKELSKAKELANIPIQEEEQEESFLGLF